MMFNGCGTPTSVNREINRTFISLAAFSVNVMAKHDSGGALVVVIIRMSSSTINVVFPDPAVASMQRDIGVVFVIIDDAFLDNGKLSNSCMFDMCLLEHLFLPTIKNF